ncbi:hypothetical protein KKG41_01175 [Patescibacteria group bacterium]|nr:hypothetical protein [Patescibacteria group bacterium]
MARAFCPKCGNFSYGYDPQIKIYRCYTLGCEFVDTKKEYGKGLSENPFNGKKSSQLERVVTSV